MRDERSAMSAFSRAESSGRRTSISVMMGCVAVLVPLLSGCATSTLNTARHHFYAGKYGAAADSMAEMPAEDTDRVLFLMERGAVKQARGSYAASTEDWLAADALARRLDYLSVSRGTTSLVVNDRVMRFRGAPYERTLLHAFAAKNYFALGLWEDAAVEGRNIIFKLEHRNDFPDDPYSRYLAAFSLEMIGDSEGARFQRGEAAKLLPQLGIDEASGTFHPIGGKAGAPPPDTRQGSELVCFVGLGRAPKITGSSWKNEKWGPYPYVEIFHDGKLLGRSYTFTTTGQLLRDTEAKLAKARTLKSTVRIAIKEAAAQTVEHENQALGEVLRMLLFFLEQPDTRRWETLPMWLQVVRAPCPPDLSSYEVVCKGLNGKEIHRMTVKAPLQKQGPTFVSFCRAF